MTKKELIKNDIKIYLSPHSFHWVKELPEKAQLAKNLTPFREYNNEKGNYISKIGEIYFEKSNIINGYWLVSIKEYTNFEILQDYIIKQLIYF